MDVLISLIVVIISRYIRILKHCVLQPECVQLLFVNHISVELEKKKKIYIYSEALGL